MPSPLVDSGACPPPMWIVVVVWVGWAGRAVHCMAAFFQEASKVWKNKENIRKAPEKQAPPHPRNLRPYHRGGVPMPAAGGAYMALLLPHMVTLELFMVIYGWQYYEWPYYGNIWLDALGIVH